MPTYPPKPPLTPQEAMEGKLPPIVLPPPAPGTMVGCSRADATLRLWLAHEAMRQAEQQFDRQTSSLQALETRATALLTWSVTITVATLITSARSGEPALIATAAMMFIASVICISALWPKQWYGAGYDPSNVLQEQLETELEILQDVALAYDQSLKDNRGQLARMGSRLRYAWAIFTAAPIVAALTFLVRLI